MKFFLVPGLLSRQPWPKGRRDRWILALDLHRLATAEAFADYIQCVRPELHDCVEDAALDVKTTPSCIFVYFVHDLGISRLVHIQSLRVISEPR